jgi:ABC-2 type transport system permease protein
MIKSLQRIRGVFRRHFLLWARNPEYFFDTFWQPIVDVLIWGFFSYYLGRANSEIGALVSFFLGGVILWAVLRRGQHEITFSLMEEAWSRNLQNILMSPVGMVEYFTASILFGLAKLLVELTLMSVLVGLLFHFNVLKIGLGLIPFGLSLLLTGWALGLAVNAVIIYFGRGMVALSWIIAFVLQPFACVFYPLSAMPVWAQPLAKAFPATWIFEGMRAVLAGNGVPLGPLLLSFLLNGVYLVIGYAIFAAVMKIALDRGLLTKLEW